MMNLPTFYMIEVFCPKMKIESFRILSWKKKMSDDLLAASQGEPKCIAIVICNEIIEDKLTNNKTLVSLFNGIAVSDLPALHHRMFIMASFAEGYGKWTISITISSPSGVELLNAQGDIEFADPSNVFDMVMEVRQLPLEEEGTYFVNVHVNSNMKAYRRFFVKRSESRQQ